MPTVTFEQARALIEEKVSATVAPPTIEWVRLEDAAGRILAQEVYADRDYPPADKAMRDGFAVRSADLPGRLEVVGEVAAGVGPGDLQISAGQAVEIMTGALMPRGADQVVMIEQVSRDGRFIGTEVLPQSKANYVDRGAEAAAGKLLMKPGMLVSFPQISLMASVGLRHVEVFAKPQVAILATGDEVVPIGASVAPHQVRNSNTQTLSVQVRQAGGEPRPLPIAPDEYDRTRELMEEGLRFDLLLLSGGVSAGKYDIVEKVLADLGAEFYFTRVAIQPGQPAVFGKCRGKFFFGLPGNPGSTMVTYLIFAKLAQDLIAGRTSSPLPMLRARVKQGFDVKAGLTRFLPARLSDDGSEVELLPWRGSSDMAAIASGNCYLVTDAEKEQWPSGELIRVLPR